jgi:hypothetical protein
MNKKPWPCNQPECIKDLEEYYDPEAAKGDRFVHCEMKGCHSTYWEFKNGGRCGICHIKMCEGCQSERAEFDEDEDEWCCKICLQDGPKTFRERKEELKRKQLENIRRRQEAKRRVILRTGTTPSIMDVKITNSLLTKNVIRGQQDKMKVKRKRRDEK